MSLFRIPRVRVAMSKSAVRFDVYTLDPHQCTLLRGTEPVGLRPRAFDVLCHLARNPGRLVRKQDLIEAVWKNVAVTDDALVQCIRDIRRALRDEQRQWVKTVAGRGYVFDAPLSENTQSAVESRPALEYRQQCRTPDGVRLAVASTGSGLPVVRPPTWFNHLELDWSVQFRAAIYRFLAERAQLIRYDGRGSGLSDRYVPQFDFAALEQDLETVVDGLALQRYALLGISQGGPVAIAHAVRHPQRVSKLLLIGAYSRGRNRRSSTRDEEIANAQLTLMRHGWGDEHSAYLKTFCMYFFPSAPTDELRALADLQRMSMSADNALRMRMLCDDIDITAMLPTVSTPTLVVHSRYDNAVPLAESEYLAAAIPNAKLLVLESDNHLPLPQEPAWPVFTDAIEAFLQG